jgi:hypothetical protein
MSETLHGFVQHARRKGFDHAAIRHLLLSTGWKDKDIARAMAAEGLEIPIPEPAGGGNARDSFIYLLNFASLYVVVVAAIALYFIFLDFLYPDLAMGAVDVDAVLDGVRYSIAAIVIAFPLFLFLSLVLERIVRQSPDSPKMPVARWLTFLTMFLAAAVMVGDLITLLYYFLDGSLTVRFILKAVVLGVIGEVILAYYYFSPRGHSDAKPNLLRKSLEGAGSLIVGGALVLGFLLAGSPFAARDQRLDDKRIADLRAIHNAIQDMSTQRVNGAIKATRPLPENLDQVAEFQLGRQSVNALNLTDPVTGDRYGYQATGPDTYDLTAQFALDRERVQSPFWNHRAGNHTFKFNRLSPP